MATGAKHPTSLARQQGRGSPSNARGGAGDQDRERSGTVYSMFVHRTFLLPVDDPLGAMHDARRYGLPVPSARGEPVLEWGNFSILPLSCRGSFDRHWVCDPFGLVEKDGLSN